MARKTSKSKEVATFDAQTLDFSALGEEYGIEEGSSIAQAQVSGGGGPRLRAHKNRFEVRQGNKTLDKLKRGEAMPVVFHAFAPHVVQRQMFLNKYDDQKPFEPPVCWSDDSETPDPEAPMPQGIAKDEWADDQLEELNCDTCAHGSNGDKKCQVTSKVVVAAPVDDGEPILLDMNLNSGSLFSKNESSALGMNWLNYVKFWKKQAKLDPSRFITLISLDMDNPDEYDNQMLFKAIEPLKPGSTHWRFHDKLDKEELRERVRLTYADYEAETGTATTGTDPDDDDDDDDDDEVAETKPRRSTKKSASKKTTSKKTTSKKTTSKKTTSKKKPEPEPEPDDEEDDVEEDDEDDDDNSVDLSNPDALDDALARYEDDDDEEDDDDDEDEEDDDD